MVRPSGGMAPRPLLRVAAGLQVRPRRLMARMPCYGRPWSARPRPKRAGPVSTPPGVMASSSRVSRARGWMMCLDGSRSRHTHRTAPAALPGQVRLHIVSCRSLGTLSLRLAARLLTHAPFAPDPLLRARWLMAATRGRPITGLVATRAGVMVRGGAGDCATRLACAPRLCRQFALRFAFEQALVDWLVVI